MTQPEAVDWTTKQVGKVLDFDGAYGAQCFDYFNYYYQYLTGNNPYSDGYGVEGAKDIWDVPTNLFEKIPDSSTLVPQPGDILIYGSSWGLGYGHVESVESSTADGCNIIGQNLRGNAVDPVSRAYRSWSAMNGLTGVMRFKYNGDTPPTGGSMASSGNIESTDVDIIRIISSEVKGWDFNQVHSGAVDTQEINAWKGQPIRKFITDGWLEKSSEEFRNRRVEQMANYTNLEKQVATIPAKDAQIANLQDENAKLSNENKELKKQVSDLEAQVAAGGGDVTINFNFIGIFLWSIIKLFGYNKKG